QSPLVFRVSLDEGLDPSTLNPGQTLSLTWSADGSFDPSTNQDVPLPGFNFSTTSNELQLTPAAPLSIGYYKLWLAGNTTTNASVIQDLNGVPLCDTAGALIRASACTGAISRAARWCWSPPMTTVSTTPWPTMVRCLSTRIRFSSPGCPRETIIWRSPAQETCRIRRPVCCRAPMESSIRTCR